MATTAFSQVGISKSDYVAAANSPITCLSIGTSIKSWYSESRFQEVHTLLSKYADNSFRYLWHGFVNLVTCLI